MQEITFPSQLMEDGHLYCPPKFAAPNARFKVTVTIPDDETEKKLRPFGLCKGTFTVPDDFDAPLPDELVDAFEGK